MAGIVDSIVHKSVHAVLKKAQMGKLSWANLVIYFMYLIYIVVVVVLSLYI